MRKQRVLVFLPVSKLSGAEKRFIRLCADTPESPFEVSLLMNSRLFRQAQENGELQSLIRALSAQKRIYLIPAPQRRVPLMNLWYTLYLFLFLIRFRPAIVHSVLNHTPNILCSLLLRHKTVVEICGPNNIPPLFGDEDDLAKGDGPSKAHLPAFFLRWMLRRVDHFRCVSPSLYRRILKHLAMHDMQALEARVSASPITLFVPNPQADDYMESAQKENFILYASAFYKRKNPVLFARVLKRFLEKHADWKAAVLGGGGLAQEVETLLQDQVANKQVEKIGRVPDIYPYLARSRIYVSLIDPDNYPSQSILEAMYSKNALLCSDSGDSSKFFGPGNGILTTLAEDQILADLERLATDRQTLCAMGESSREIVETEFSKDRYYASLFELYAQVGNHS